MRARFTASGIAAGAAYVAVFMMTVLRPSAMTVVVALGLECALLAVAVLSATVAIFAWVLTRHVGYAVSMWTLMDNVRAVNAVRKAEILGQWQREKRAEPDGGAIPIDHGREVRQNRTGRAG